MAAPLTILHLGLGSFHRAHQAVCMQALADQGERGWRLVSGNIRPDMAQVEAHLAAQGGRYVLETVSPAGQRAYETIDAIAQVIRYAPNLAEHIALGADPSTRIISMTVTEAGYFLTPERTLITDAPDIAADLADGGHRTLYGALAAILSARRVADAGPVTLLSCDNLRSNGERLSAGLRAFLARRGESDLIAWCERNITTPNAMVDRITPRPPADLPARVAAVAGWADACPVMAEDFIQWVIEDHFAAGRPALETVGVQFVADVAPYEEAKIRILNASHSAIAWAGVLKGYDFIHQGARDTAIAALARAYIAEAVVPCLSPSPIDLVAYGETTLARFGNAEIRDTNQRVVADSWSKIPGFIAPTVAECLVAGTGLDAVTTLPALFLLFAERWAEGRLAFEYQDQAFDPAAMRAILAAPDPAAAFCAEPRLWGAMAGEPRLTRAVAEAHRRVRGELQV